MLLAALVVLTVLGFLSITPWWALALPGGLLLAFLVVARLTVVGMHRNLDARAEALRSGFGDNEDTVVIDCSEREVTEDIEISVDLTMPTTMGALWDPIPVLWRSW